MKLNVDPIERSGRLLIYLAVLALPFANAPITGDTLEIKTHLFRMLGVAAAILYVACAVFRHGTRKPDGVDLALLLGMGILLLSLMFAESRMASLPGALDAATSLAFFALTREIFSKHTDEDPPTSSTRPLWWVIGLSSLLPALLYVAETQRIGIPDTLGNQNVVSHYLLLTLCAPLYAFLCAGKAEPARRLTMIGYCLFLLALLWVIWMTAARGAVVGLFFASSVAASLWVARRWKRFSVRGKVSVVLVCALISLAAPVLLYKYAASTDFNVHIRFLAWKYSVTLLSDHFWLGYGPGSFVASFEKTKLWMADPDAAMLGLLTVNYAHNDFVELVVEQGVVGLSAFLFLIAACLIPAARRCAASPPDQRGESRPSADVALIFSLTASLAQAFFDFPYHTPAPRLLFYVLLGLISVPAPSAEQPAPSARPACGAVSWMWSAFILIAAVLPSLPVLSVYAGSAIAKVAEPMFKSGRYDAVKHLHTWAAQLDPTRSIYSFRRGLGEEQAGEFLEAGRSFRTALGLQPYFPNIYFHLGTISMKNDPARAASAFSASLAFLPTSVTLHNLSAVALSLGDSPSAAGLYQEIARRFPDDDRARRNAEILRAPQEQQKPEAFRTALDLYQQGRLEPARQSAANYLKGYPADPEGIFLLGRILFHQGNYDEAARMLKDYLSREPGDPEGHYYMGNLHFFQNRMDESIASYTQAARLSPHSPKILYNLGVAYYSVGDFSSMNNCFDTVFAVNPNVSFRPKMEEMRMSAERSGR